MSDIVLKTAWRRDDPALMEDARAFWTRLNKMPPEQREARARQIGVVAYAGDQVVAVTTAELETLPGLRARFAVFQVVVDPEFRRRSMSRRIVSHFLTVLEAWSLDHPDEKLMGMAAVIEAAEYSEWQREPVWADWGLNLVLTGYTPRNQQIRVAWFRHARV